MKLIILVLLASAQSYNSKNGNSRGTRSLDDDNVLTVINFLYPSPGPDAFFWAGENGGCDGDSIDNKSYNLIPGGRGHSDYFSQDQPILKTYDGKQKDLVLRLPKGVTVSDLSWLCVWCRKFKVNFGGIKINAKP